MGADYIYAYVAIALYDRNADMCDQGSADCCQIQKQYWSYMYECYSTAVSITGLVSIILQYATNLRSSIKSNRLTLLNSKLSPAKFFSKLDFVDFNSLL